MEHLDVENVEQFSDRIILHVKMKVRACHCPACGAVTQQIHDYHLQQIKDSPIHGKHVVWMYHKRRYRCHSCGKRFSENNALVPKWHRITNRLAAQCLFLFSTNQSRKDIAFQLGISESTVGRWLSFIDHPKPKTLPMVLSIDEFKGDTQYGKYQCILTAPLQKTVLDILPTRYSSQLFDYFSTFPNRKQVKYWIMDMNKEYLNIAKLLFPQATVVIDRFHVVRYCNWALENVRKRVQKRLPKSERIYFKRSRTLLLASMSKLSPESKAAVEQMLLVSRDLREAYLLKELFYSFMHSENIQQAKQRLRQFLLQAELADIPEFKPCITMLRNWQPYILNAFDCPYSNGFTEGVNNTVKVIKRIAYGYRNFLAFRARIFAVVNRKRELNAS